MIRKLPFDHTATPATYAQDYRDYASPWHFGTCDKIRCCIRGTRIFPACPLFHFTCLAMLVCQICFEDVGQSPRHTLEHPFKSVLLPTCHHTFHFDCLRKLAMPYNNTESLSLISPSCPVCRCSIRHLQDGFPEDAAVDSLERDFEGILCIGSHHRRPLSLHRSPCP